VVDATKPTIVAISTSAGRVSPVFDTARQLLLLHVSGGVETGRRIMTLDETDGERRVGRVVETGADALICGAISSLLRVLLDAAGIQVFANTCGPVEEVASAFISGRWTDEAFLMPGCCMRRQRYRGGRPE